MLLLTTEPLPDLQAQWFDLVRFALGTMLVLSACGIAAAWLGKDRFLSIFESERVLSSRLIMFCVVVLFGLHLQSWALRTPGIDHELALRFLDADWIFAGSLAGFGTLKVAASRFAPKPNVDSTELAAKEQRNRPE